MKLTGCVWPPFLGHPVNGHTHYKLVAPKGEGKLFLHQLGESEGTASQSEIGGVWGTLIGHMLFYRGLHLGLTCAYVWVVSRGVTRPAVSP